MSVSGGFVSENLASSPLQVAIIALPLRAAGLERSAARLMELAEIQDFEEGEHPLSVESAQGFQKFILECRYLREPLLELFPEGTLSAEWRFADHKYLALEFLGSDQISCAVMESGRKIIVNESGSHKKILSVLREYGVLKIHR